MVCGGEAREVKGPLLHMSGARQNAPEVRSRVMRLPKLGAVVLAPEVSGAGSRNAATEVRLADASGG